MNKNISKIKDGVLIGVGIISVMAVANAWNGLKAESGDTLLLTKWNELVSKVDGIYTDGSGNVGIGNTTPSAQLHIKGSLPYIAFEDTEDPNGSFGTITSHQDGRMYYDANNNNSSTSGAHRFRADGAVKNLMSIENNGNVGIGTTNPTGMLHIVKDDNFGAGDQLLLESTLSNEMTTIKFRGNDSSGSNDDALIMRRPDLGSGLLFHENGKNAFIIRDGNVGIGTTNPGSKLEIAGGLSGDRTNGLRINPASDADCWIYAGGNSQGCADGGSEIYRGSSGVMCAICN